MIQNALFRQCLAAIPEEQKAEFELKFRIAERISEVLKAKNLTQKDFAQKLHKRESEIAYLRCKDSASESRTSNLFECYAERSLSYLKIMVRGTKMGQKRAKKRKRLHEDAY